MCTLYDRVVELCKIKGVSASRMCLDLGLSKSTMSNIKNGRASGFSAVTAQKIAAYFGVTVGYLLGEEEKEEKPTAIGDGLSDGEKAWLELYRMMPDEQTRAILVKMVEQYSALSADAQELVLRLIRRDTAN